MAEEATVQAAERQAGEVGQPTDWQAKYEAMRAHSREWEKQAKANREAAEELEKLRAEQMGEQEKANRRAEKAEAELSELKARAERAQAVAEAAERAGVPAEAVSMLNGADAAELAAQMERMLKLLPAYPTRTDEGGGSAAANVSNAQRFARSLEGII